jgi:hypothetical protein
MNQEIPNAETKTLVFWLIVSLLIWAAVAVMTGCALQHNDDGPKDFLLTEPTVLRAIEVIAEK